MRQPAQGGRGVGQWGARRAPARCSGAPQGLQCAGVGMVGLKPSEGVSAAPVPLALVTNLGCAAQGRVTSEDLNVRAGPKEAPLVASPGGARKAGK